MAQLGLNTVFGKVTAQIEFLHAGADGIPRAQAFRFQDMDSVSSRRYGDAVKQMQTAGFSDVEEKSTSIGDVTSQTLSKLRGSINRLSGVISSGRRTRA